MWHNISKPIQKLGLVLSLAQWTRDNILDWQNYFPELPRKRGYKSLLVLTDTFSVWPEAFPSQTNKAKEVANILLDNIMPLFRVLLDLLENIAQQFCNNLQINWHLHMLYGPQASSQVETMNYPVQNQIVETGQEANTPWPQTTHLALLQIWVRSRTKEKLNTFEMLCRIPDKLNYQGEDTVQAGEGNLQDCVVQLHISYSKVINTFRAHEQEDAPLHKSSLGTRHT